LTAVRLERGQSCLFAFPVPLGYDLRARCCIPMGNCSSLPRKTGPSGPLGFRHQLDDRFSRVHALGTFFISIEMGGVHPLCDVEVAPAPVNRDRPGSHARHDVRMVQEVIRLRARLCGFSIPSPSVTNEALVQVCGRWQLHIQAAGS